VSEQIDFEPAKFFRRRLVREKCVHGKEVDAVPVVAPLPPVLQERCIAARVHAPDFGGKVNDYLPLYGQESITGSGIRYGCRGKVWRVGGTCGGLVEAHLRSDP